MDNIKIGMFLKALRKEKNFTQQQVADQLFLNPKTISKWENGDSIPDISIITTVANLYNVTVDEILKGERNKVEVKETFNTQNENVLAKSIIKKHNVLLIISISLASLMFIVGLILGMIGYNYLYLVFIPFGLIIGLVPYLIAKNEAKAKISEINDENDKIVINRNIKRISFYYLDLNAAFIIFYLVTCLLYITAVNATIFALATYPFVLLGSLIYLYLVLRDFIKNKDYSKTMKKIEPLLLLLSIFIVLFAIEFEVHTVRYTFYPNISGNFVPVESSYSTSYDSYPALLNALFINWNMFSSSITTYIIRICLILIVLSSIVGLILSYKSHKTILQICLIIGGIIAEALFYYVFNFNVYGEYNKIVKECKVYYILPSFGVILLFIYIGLVIFKVCYLKKKSRQATF